MVALQRTEIYNDLYNEDLLEQENIELVEIQSEQPYTTTDNIIKAQEKENDFVKSVNIGAEQQPKVGRCVRSLTCPRR